MTPAVLQVATKHGRHLVSFHRHEEQDASVLDCGEGCQHSVLAMEADSSFPVSSCSGGSDADELCLRRVLLQQQRRQLLRRTVLLFLLASVENVFDNVLERENDRQAIDANDLCCFSMNSVYIYVMWTVTMVKEREVKRHPLN